MNKYQNPLFQSKELYLSNDPTDFRFFKSIVRQLKLKINFSMVALMIILFSFVALRSVYFENNSKNGYNATSWDAFGYYMYLPSIFIYQDVKELKWIPEMDAKYNLTGGNLYQAIPLKNNGIITYTNKYLLGISIMQLPFFLMGHCIAGMIGVNQDGFSWPYQYAILLAAIFWTFFGFIFLRKVLLTYFDSRVTGLTLILIALASNLIQYVSVDGGMSHAYIFSMYCFVIWLTIKWHKTPLKSVAFFLGLLMGLAIISRPTELLIILIPLFWGHGSQKEKSEKWKLVIQHQSHLLFVFTGGLIGVLPQLIYWKYTAGSFIYDVGSKWYFLNPWFRVLFGSEKGWFLYTPIAILMIYGLLLMKNQTYKKAVMIFCLLNIWVIISWSDWRYGASYSTRALIQSYPVLAFPLALTIQFLFEKGHQRLLILVSIGLIYLNFYQISIYNQNVMENFSPIWRALSFTFT